MRLPRLVSQILLTAALGALAPAQISRPLFNPAALPWNFQRSLALAYDGYYWAMIRNNTTLKDELWRSEKCDLPNTAWTKIADLPTADSGTGSIVIDPDCVRLHVLWSAVDGGGFTKVFYQAFNISSPGNYGWIGVRTRVSPATDLWHDWASDIEVTPRGRVFAAYIRQNPWSVWLVPLPGGTPVQVNTDTLGWGINMQAVHEVLHMSFRTNTGGYGIRYRAYDACSGAFLTPTDLQVRTQTSNVSHIAADGCGGIYIMSAGAGNLYVDYHPTAGTVAPTTNVFTIADAGLSAGNVSYSNYSLCAGPGTKIWPLFSPASTGHTLLYAAELDNGVLTGAPGAGAPQPANTYAALSGFRSTQSTSGMVGLIVDQSGAGSLVSYAEFNPPNGPPYGRRTTKYGTPCECGSCSDSVPELDAWSPPNASPLSVTLSVGNTPFSNNSGVLMIGAAPLHVSIPRLPCLLHTDPFITLPFTKSPAKGADITISVPTLALQPCTIVYFQVAVFAPPCNFYQAVLSNGLMAVFE
jgi:hypothetical protein